MGHGLVQIHLVQNFPINRRTCLTKDCLLLDVFDASVTLLPSFHLDVEAVRQGPFATRHEKVQSRAEI